MMRIEPIALLQDNYAWLLIDDTTRRCVVIDPSISEPVRQKLASLGLVLDTLLITHHHHDHTGGIAGLIEPQVRVIGSWYEQDRIPHMTQTVADGSIITLLHHQVHCMHVPGHTQGAMAYYIPQAQAVFTGDTLFTAGCGRLFEGTAEQMHTSLARLASLPAATWLYCGHEYTEKNLRYASTIWPDNQAITTRLMQVIEQRRLHKPSVPAKMELEQTTNLFLQAHHPVLQAKLATRDTLATFKLLRSLRDKF